MSYWSVLLTRIVGGVKFIVRLRTLLGQAFIDFKALDNTEEISFVLGCELWTENFDYYLL